MTRGYFPGETMFDYGVRADARDCPYCGKPLAFIGPDEDNSPTAMLGKCWGRYVDHDHGFDGLTLAQAVAAAEARRDCSNGGQLELPAEYLPVASGELFS